MSEKEVKEIELVTINDVFNAIDDENFERFMLDFMMFVHQIGEVKKKHPDLIVRSMIWKDDGVHEITGATMNGETVLFKGKKDE